MAKSPKLKVYVTPIGFHDAYVAAPSQKAALKAWGTATDLFGAGRAAIVESGDAYGAALATPGTVVKRLRGSEAAMLDFPEPAPVAAPPDRRADAAKADVAKRPPSRPAAKTTRPAKPKPEPAPKPEPPDRAPLDAAEVALDRAQRDLADEIARIEAERRALDAREAALVKAASEPLRTLRDARDAAERAYEAATAAFRRRR